MFVTGHTRSGNSAGPSRGQRQAASIRDVARAAGVSCLGATALDPVPAHVSCATVVEAPPPGSSPGLPAVRADDREAAPAAPEHLWAPGHDTVHYVAVPASTESRRSVEPRAGSRRPALESAGVAAPEPSGRGWDAQAGYEAGKELARNPEVTAILCGNDDLALGVLRALHHAGRRVPKDGGVTGFDDAPHSAYVTPSLTTVRMDFQRLGRAAFGLPRARLDTDQRAPAAVPAEPALVLRESTAPRRT
ncbi:substrate-binding domain-containing protein [Streptomyces sp. NPDC002130]|uniref:substrate-binding domain-containing protein n=1 Tax=Streptomyces sp. NPDC002130 TaxID=3155568 RepID=UPI00331F1749